MPWYLYLALKQLFASWQRFFFTAICIFSVGLGVLVMVVVLSVMGGFAAKIGEMTVNTQGDIQIRAQEVIADPAALAAVVARVPGVVATTPFGQGIAFVQHDNHPAFALIQGIEPDSVSAVAPLGQYVRVGSLDALDDDSVILSDQLAQSLGAGMGSKVEIYSPAIVQHATSGDEAVLPRELTIVGIFKIGHQQLDRSTAIITLRTMQDLYDLGSGVHGLELKIASGLDVDVETARVNQALIRAQGHQLPRIEGLWAESWKAAFADFLWAVEMEKRMMTFILLIVVLVAAFLNMGLLVVMVLKKTREIGLLGALGATRLQVALCFCLQGVCIGVAGTAAGVVLGFALLHYRNQAVDLLARLTGGSMEAVASVYQFSQIPAHLDGSDLVVIVVAAIVLSTLAGAVPAVMAARLKPVAALRHE